jgi:acyl-CoA synthetase (AMP-forming)/AMP-acid ligase II
MYSDTKRRLLETFFAGAVFIIFDKESLTVSKMKNEYQITILRTTVYHIEKVLHTFVKTRQKPFDFLRILSIGTAVVSDELRERISKYLTSKLYITYGTNETGTVSAANLSKYPNISGSVGLAFSGVQIEIVDNEGKPLKKGIIGNVRIKTPGAILGYMNNQTATDKAFKNGWFYPGDRGKLTEDGQLIYMGRSDHMMIINGINIYPIEIEKVVITHPCVKDAAALPIRLSQQVAIPVCAVELNEMCNTTEEELKTYAYQYLGSRSPAKIIILDRIPRNSIGKLDHKELQTKTIHGFKNSVSYVKH